MARTLAWLSCVAVAAIGTLASGRAQVVVKIDSGQLSGRTESGVSAYLGIPYAAPPVGAARWEAPARPAPWKGVRSAEAYGANCPQTTNEGNHLGPWTSEYLISGPAAEDCLFLNVWTPAGGARHPVLVWLHGGAFTSGSGSVVVYNGQHLARQGIVVVTINYRLGALGFLSAAALGPHSGNDGLLDMIAALQWVKRNIPAFGGDPSRVTVAGQSAGAAAVLALMASPAAKGLFARAIAESGAGVFTLGQSLQEAQHQAAEFAQAKGATNAAALRALSPDALIAPLTAPAPSAPSQHSPPAPSAPPPRITFGPVIDETVVSPEPGAGSDVPLLTGLVADEASALDPSYGQATPASLKEHSCEIPYVFGTLEAGGRPFGAADRELSRMVMRYWVNFISTGDPNGAGLPAWPC